MRWIKKVPTKPGIYLRNNPESCHIVRQDVFEILGKMCISGEGLSAIRLEKWHGAKLMWWYGPIPKPRHLIKRTK